MALPLLLLALPYLNKITQSEIHITFLSYYGTWFLLAGIITITGLVAGSYPAFYLSGFQALKVIKGNFTSHISAAGISRLLVVFQFVLSIALIVSIIVIYSQLNYIQNKDLGFNKTQKLIFNFHTDDTINKMQSFVNDLRQLAEIKAVSKSNNYLSHFVFEDHGVYLAGGNMPNAVDIQNMTTDEYFCKANGIQLFSGRDFRLYDSGKVLVNETFIKRLGLQPETAPGTRLYTQYAPEPVSFDEIAGVMKNFNYNSLYDEVRPFMLVYSRSNEKFSYITLATDSKNYHTLLQKIETIWHSDLPAIPFEYSFLDDEVQKQYEKEIILSRIINSFTLIAILISCLGLFGLASFSAEQKKKEIGIRKVLGASVSGIVWLLSKDFIKLVIVLFVIATPVAWWAMDKWLQNFAYRISVTWWMFAIAGPTAIFITLLTVSFQAIKAAMANPVKSLRAE